MAPQEIPEGNSVERVSVQNEVVHAAKEAVFSVGQVSRDLRHPVPMRLTCNARDLYGPGLQLHDEEDDVSDESGHRQYLDGEEVGCCQLVPMRGEECLPRGCRAAFRCGRDAVVLQDRFDRVPGEVVTEIHQPAADSGVAPGRILVRHADDERGDVRLGRRTTGPSAFLPVVLVGNEPPVPPQDRVGCHDAGDGREVTTAENVTFHGETASLVVGQARPSGTVHGAEDSVLLEQVVNDRLLVSIDPAGEPRRKKASGCSGSMA